MKEIDYPPHRSRLGWWLTRRRHNRPWQQFPFTHDERGIKPSNPAHREVDELQVKIGQAENPHLTRVEIDIDPLDLETVKAKLRLDQEDAIQDAIEFQGFLDNVDNLPAR